MARTRLLLPWLLAAIACLAAPSRQFELGTTYKYGLQSDVFLNEAAPRPAAKTSKSVGYGLRAAAAVTCLWKSPQDPLNRLFRIELSQVHLTVVPADSPESGRSEHGSQWDAASPLPLYVLQQSNEIVKVWSHKESPTSVNIKKAVASMLQYQLTPEDKQQVDVSGRCSVSFKTERNTISKHKTLCTHPDKTQYFYPNHIQSPTVLTKSTSLYELLPDMTAPKSVQISEQTQMYVNILKEASILVKAEHSYKLESTSPSGQTFTAATEAEVIQKLTAGQKLTEDTIVARPEPKKCTKNCKSLAENVKLFESNLRAKNLATLKSALSFLRLLESFREASEKEVHAVLKSSKNKNIAPQLLDLAAATQTVASVKAALKFLNFNSEGDLAERFLVGLLAASHPSPAIITEILGVCQKDIRNQKNKASAVAALGALVNVYCRGHRDCEKTEAVGAALKFLEDKLRQCKEEPCWQMHLRGLQNAAQPSTLPTLLYAVRKGGKKAVLSALRAIKQVGNEHFNDQVLDALQKVYGQVDRRHDSTARALAAELIFSSTSVRHIERTLELLPRVEAPELATFVASKLFELVDRADSGRSFAGKVLSNSTFGNYYNLAHSGSSATFTKYLTKGEDLNSTYAVNMELIPGGLLKESSLDVNLETPDERLNLISVGLFAGGLDGLAGGDDSGGAGGEEEEATAGMRLSLLGYELRPYVFFVGTSELMSHVWSGTASEPTPALQGNLLLMDHYQFVALLNGLVLELKLQGVISLDMTGSIQISLWNRNSHSVVRTSGATVVQASASLNSDAASSHVQLNVAGDTHLEFVTDLDFYEKPYKMCIQMTQPGVVLRHNIRKYESVTGRKHLVRRLKRRSQNISGKSYAFHKKNCEYCSVLLADV
ncbi:microsomal triacylglycerol transfer protein [Amblyomma americanum]